jgi:hypothetical protein
MELLKAGLAPFAEREAFARISPADRKLAGKPMDAWDVAALLNFMWIKWNEVYNRTLDSEE